MICRQCKSVDRFKPKFKKIRQNLMVCTVCGYHQIKGLHSEDANCVREEQDIPKEIILNKIDEWKQEKIDILDKKYRNHLINNSGDALICDTIIQVLNDLLVLEEEL